MTTSAAPRRFPEGKSFAFTIIDDTDDATVKNVRPVYELLAELGIITTKTVWPVSCPEGSRLYFAGSTLQEREYLSFIRLLQSWGFEIASHGATMEPSVRARTIRGLDVLERELGVKPRLHCNHGHNTENLYWGYQRYQSSIRHLVRAADRLLRRPFYEGHIEGSPYFWGDLSLEFFDYVRNFAFAVVNTAHVPPATPYRVESTPWVKAWFNSSDAPDANAFIQLMQPHTVDALARDGGYCILSTHLGKGFVQDGSVVPTVERTLRYISSLSGWFVPASTLLDHLSASRPTPTLSGWPLFSLEARHVLDRAQARGIGI